MGSFFSKSDSFNPERDIVDLKGRVIIVTGGNRGIGYETVKFFVKAGPKVYLAARDESKATGAIKQMENEVGNVKGKGEVIFLKLDLGDLKATKRAAEEFSEKEQRLDILVNNAALQIVPYKKTQDGISESVLVNHIAPSLFTQALLPLLKSTADEPKSDVRIIVLSSMVHRQFSFPNNKFSEIEDFNVTYEKTRFSNLRRYAHTKLMNVLFAKSLQSRLPNITVISVHPGGVNTFSHTLPLHFILTPILNLVLSKPDKGTYSTIFAAASKTVAEDREKYKGKYLEDKPTGVITKSTKEVEDPNAEMAEDLWKLTEKYLEDRGVVA